MDVGTSVTPHQVIVSVDMIDHNKHVMMLYYRRWYAIITTIMFLLNTEPGGDIDNRITTAPKKRNTKCITFCLITCTLIFLLGVSVCAAAMFILEKVLSNSELKTATTFRPLEIQPGDTVLLYQGDASDLVVTEMVPPDENRPNIQLYVIDCGKLMKYKKAYVVGSKSIDLRSNVSLPIPTRYLHYELGSHFNFSVDIVDASEHSYLTIFIFDNTTQANEYTKYQTTETRQQAIKYWSIPTNITNITTTLLFEVTYGAYFVPVFSFETSGVLEIEFSYVITQYFYLHTDYIPYKYTNCSLMADEKCSLDLKVFKNKTCVLAYNQASLETYQGPVVMQTVTETSEVVIPQYKHYLRIVGYVIVGFFGIIALFFFIFYLLRRRSVKKTYQYVALDNYY